MNSDTKTRLLETATTLFAEHGYRGASVRHICDLARANPGAVSYHFGGKKQLYRTVLRRAAAAIADPTVAGEVPADDAPPLGITEILERIAGRMTVRSTETRLLLRDLTDGGSVAVEALEPTLRAAYENLRLAIGEDTATRASDTARALFLDLAAPLFLLTAAWPLLERALDLEPDRRRDVLADSCRRALEVNGLWAPTRD